MDNTGDNQATLDSKEHCGLKERLRFIKILPVTLRVTLIFSLNIIYTMIWPPKH